MMKKFLLIAFVGLGVVSTAQAVTFKSPSGNIICAGDGYEVGTVTCDIIDKNSNKPIRPVARDCDGDWGNRFYVDHRKAGLACAYDVPYGQAPSVLAYGKSISGKGWTCTSQTTGMTCKNSAGRGFSLSRASQKLF